MGSPPVEPGWQNSRLSLSRRESSTSAGSNHGDVLVLLPKPCACRRLFDQLKASLPAQDVEDGTPVIRRALERLAARHLAPSIVVRGEEAIEVVGGFLELPVDVAKDSADCQSFRQAFIWDVGQWPRGWDLPLVHTTAAGTAL
jgi:hypothetical protein